ncbi:hypothetical protein HNP93_001393 [Methanococcus maripaludis]|nr:hypothetical protein [Methanococcus maripaludis]MBA2858692.1 hypothetical protein [Methanococcus maripaludis]MBB6497866.1 hypothetical protein [Methanococcus maripaludis]
MPGKNSENFEHIKKMVDILKKYENTPKYAVTVMKNNIGMSVNNDVKSECEKQGIPKNKIDLYFREIFGIINKKVIEKKSDETETSKYVLKNLYHESFGEKYEMFKSQVCPLFEKISLMNLRKTDSANNEYKSKLIKIVLSNEDGTKKIINFECTSDELINIIEVLSEM